jgi:hypothetical protein
LIQHSARLPEDRERLSALAHALQHVRLHLPEERIARVACQQVIELVQRRLELPELEEQVRMVEARQREAGREFETARQQGQGLFAAAEADLRARHEAQRVDIVVVRGQVRVELAHGALGVALRQNGHDLPQGSAAHGPARVKLRRGARESIGVRRRG